MISVREIEARLHEALKTLAALPDRESRFLRQSTAAWPTTLREAVDVMALAYGRMREGKSAYEAMRPPREVPSAQAIDRMDEALRWFAFLSERDQKIITLRAFGATWPNIAARYHRSDTTCQTWYSHALWLVREGLKARPTNAKSAPQGPEEPSRARLVDG